jgi:hypothetical protein
MATAGMTAPVTGRPACGDRAGNITRSLLGYLALAGPFYVLVSLVQALTRDGFSLAHDEWSLLATGPLGWIQVANLALTGAMLVAGAVGFGRATGRAVAGGTWAPRLLAGYGAALILAGVFRADPAYGFPPGTPAGRAVTVSWHGALHLVFGSIGFACLIAACFGTARLYSRRGQRRAAVLARVTGTVFTVAFAGIASGSGSAIVNLAFTAAVIISFGWLMAVAVNLYRGTRPGETPGTGVAR